MNRRMTNFYMSLAEQCALMSRAEKMQVGAVIVKNENVISFSWNGTPAGWDNSCEVKDYWDNTEEDLHYDELETLYPHFDEYGRYRLQTRAEVIHAERNAIDKLARSHESGLGATLFVTHAPCIECAKSIYSAGIVQVYYKNEYKNTNGLDFLRRCGVEVSRV